MPKTLRYFILLVGFLIFLGLAPLIIMYVRGVKFSDNQQKYLLTGIFAVKTNPKGADIAVNGQSRGTTPINIRFLDPAEYDISISKDGFLPWKKRLEIGSGKVTWVNPNPSDIYLFKANPITTTLSETVNDFTLTASQIALASGKNLILIAQGNAGETQTVTLPEVITSVSANEDKDSLLIKTENKRFIYALGDKKLTDISSKTKDAEIIIGSYPYLFILKNQILTAYNWSTDKTTPIWINVQSFGVSSGAVYGLLKDNTTNQLVTTFIDNNFSRKEIILTEVPNFNQVTIIPTKQKLLFILADHTLYRVGFSLERITDAVNTYRYDATDGSLIFTTSGELAYYSFTEAQIKLITRSSEKFPDFLMRSDMAHSFYINGGKAEIRELDNRGGQNAYTITTDPGLKKIALDPSGRTLYLLINTMLQSIAIR